MMTGTREGMRLEEDTQSLCSNVSNGLPSQTPNKGRNKMTLCPIALVAGCKKCPAVTVCPLKSAIGDYQKPGETQTKQDAEKAPRRKAG